MAIGATKKVLLLGGMGIIRWYIIHVRAVASDLTGNSADISSYESCYFSIAQSIHEIFPYTTPFFYAKMMVVHTGLLSVVCRVVTSFYQRSV